jgi:hypothetical protein
MYICFVCDKPVKEDEEFIWHGLDGEKIHKRCEKDAQKAYDRINNMTSEEFCRYLTGY